MKKILIDLNVLLDFLNKRNEHYQAAKIVDLCIDKRITGYICAHEITTLAYFLTKEGRGNKTKPIISRILDVFSTIPITEAILRDALHSRIRDYEDAVVESSCLRNEIELIVSRNLRDFRQSRVKAVSPKEYVAEYNVLRDRENR